MRNSEQQVQFSTSGKDANRGIAPQNASPEVGRTDYSRETTGSNSIPRQLPNVSLPGRSDTIQASSQNGVGGGVSSAGRAMAKVQSSQSNQNGVGGGDSSAGRAMAKVQSSQSHDASARGGISAAGMTQHELELMQALAAEKAKTELLKASEERWIKKEHQARQEFDDLWYNRHKDASDDGGGDDDGGDDRDKEDEDKSRGESSRSPTPKPKPKPPGDGGGGGGGGGDPSGPSGGGVAAAGRGRSAKRRQRSRSESSDRPRRREALTLKFESISQQGALFPWKTVW